MPGEPPLLPPPLFLTASSTCTPATGPLHPYLVVLSLSRFQALYRVTHTWVYTIIYSVITQVPFLTQWQLPLLPSCMLYGSLLFCKPDGGCWG